MKERMETRESIAKIFKRMNQQVCPSGDLVVGPQRMLNKHGRLNWQTNQYQLYLESQQREDILEIKDQTRRTIEIV